MLILSAFLRQKILSKHCFLLTRSGAKLKQPCQPHTPYVLHCIRHLAKSLNKTLIFNGLFMIVALTSITYVNKAQYLLSQNNIKSSIVKLRSSLERRGCGYGLEVRENFVRTAMSLIENNGIRIVEIANADD